jgi:hypothetical protein
VAFRDSKAEQYLGYVFWPLWFLRTRRERARRQPERPARALMTSVRKPVLRGKVWVSSQVSKMHSGERLEREGRLPTADEILDAFPPDLRAADEHEARTVVFLKWTATTVGTYGSGATIPTGGQAVQISCLVEVLDKAATKVIAKKTFWGSPPPKEILTSQERHGYSHVFGAYLGSVPTDEIKAWLKTARLEQA